jgi:hypothetical protein
MSNKRLIKTGIFALIAVGVIVFSLALLTGTGLAQGPSGRGNGDGSRGQGSGQPGQPNAGQAGLVQNWLGNLPPAVPGDVPADVIDALYAGLTDEHHAYDTYQAVIDQFGAVRPFTSIQQAEANHIAALESLFERYGLDIPAVAPLPEVQSFDTLADACAAGANAEIANFSLYDQWMAAVQDYPDMVQVFTALRDASEYQHLPTFERCAG